MPTHWKNILLEPVEAGRNPAAHFRKRVIFISRSICNGYNSIFGYEKLFRGKGVVKFSVFFNYIAFF